MKKLSAIFLFLLILPSNFTKAARIKDIVEIIGLHENTLMGMGLVVGLQNTGDKSEAAIKALRNLLRKYKFNLATTDLALGNVALVMVTAKLPPLIRKGSKIDVQVSSIGDAKSLAGGMLLTTFLRALNNKVYAVAQGVLSQSNSNLPTIAIVSNGATVEREVPVSLISRKGELILRLKNPDFNTANRIAMAINRKFANEIPCCYAMDMASVKVIVPLKYRRVDKISKFIAEIFTLSVTPDNPARVVINERTGTIIIGESVTISPVTIAHNQITVRITADPNQEQITVQKLVKALFALRVTPKDLVAIFRMLKRAGALHAELIIS